MASLIQNINQKYARHIITLENPIEYLHRHDKSIVNQREIGTDAADYPQALWAAVRQDPDVIMVGEMNDMDTISMVLNAAENGHLVLASLHTTGAENTIERIIDVFPPAKQQQIRIQLASVLECIISQQLIKRTDGEGRVAAMEILTVNQVIRSLIRDDKTYQLPSVMQSGRKLGMQTIMILMMRMRWIRKMIFWKKRRYISQKENRQNRKKDRIQEESFKMYEGENRRDV